MAMVVKNNMQAVNTLNTLNKNQSELSKSLQKVSSGMKINNRDLKDPQGEGDQRGERYEHRRRPQAHPEGSRSSHRPDR